MIVGFTLIDFKGHEQDAIEFIQKVCVLESPDIAENIVSAGIGVNVYAKGLTFSELERQPFSVLPIETREGKVVIASVVNFNVEIQYNGNTIKLSPTEYIYVEEEEAPQFERYVLQGLLKAFPATPLRGEKWILENGSWDDNGVWDDTNYWRDSE